MEKMHNNESILKQADRLLDERRLDEAEILYGKLHSEDNSNTEVLLKLGMIDRQRGNLAAAIDKLKEATKINANDYKATLELGKTLHSAGLLDDAIERFRHATRIDTAAIEPRIHAAKIHLHLKQYSECESMCNMLKDLDDANTEVLLLLASCHIAQNRIALAINTYRTVLDRTPGDASTWRLLGSAYLMAGEVHKAVCSLDTSLSFDPDNAQTHMMQGNAWILQNQPGNALRHLKEAVRLSPNFAGSWNLLISTYRDINKLDEMIEYCTHSIETYPNNPLTWTYMGYAYEYLRQYEMAVDAYKHAVSLTSGRYDLWERMGNICILLDRQDEAFGYLSKGLEYGSKNSLTNLNYAKILRSRGCEDECETRCKRILELSPEYVPALIELGMALIDKGDYKTAIHHFEQARVIEPENTEAISGMAQAYDRLGDYSESYNVIHPLLESGCMDPGIACTFAKISSHIKKSADATSLIEKVLQQDTLASLQRTDLHFMAGALYDKQGLYSRAMHHFNTANSLKPTNFNKKEYAKFVDNIIHKFSKQEFTSRKQPAGHDVRPIFIIGMMRSGTSLVEQLLASHEAVHGCGELMGITLAAREIGMYQSDFASRIGSDKFPTVEKLEELARQYLGNLPAAARKAKLFTDKMPSNFLNLGLIALLFPEAKIIHVKRNPLDTCLSAYFINFSARHDFAYDLGNLGFYYREYLRLMSHWRSNLPIEMLDVEYEELVNDVEKVCRIMLDFCDLGWSENVLDFHNSERIVNTASYDQVRKPIYRSSIGHWKNYEDHLEPLINALDS